MRERHETPAAVAFLCRAATGLAMTLGNVGLPDAESLVRPDKRDHRHAMRDISFSRAEEAPPEAFSTTVTRFRQPTTTR